MAWAAQRRDDVIVLSGELRIDDAAPIWKQLDRLASRSPPRAVDLGGVAGIDGAVIALVIELRRRFGCRIVGASPGIARIMHMHAREAPLRAPADHDIHGVLRRVGLATERTVARAGGVVGFFGELAGTIGRIALRRAHVTWRALAGLVERTGADAVVIVVVMNFLIGFILAYQTSRPLALFGANIYVADLIGISLTREIAPLVTAAIMAGRAGAAFTAELGTMRVGEEVDALRTLGFSPMAHLVLPRICALVIVMPVLTLVADIVGIVGGALVATVSLDVAPPAFLAELRLALVPSDVWTGLVKSAAFGAAIAIIACHHGLATTGGAEGVGRRTTATVVTSLLAIVVLDTGFTVVFRGFDV